MGTPAMGMPAMGMPAVGMPAMGAVTSPGPNRPPNPCKPSTVDRASLHASVLFKTSLMPPKTKEKVLYDCGGRAVALFKYGYDSPKKASEAAMYMGAQLWGAGGRSRRHADEVLVRDAEVIVLSPRPGPLGAHLAQQGFKAYRGQKRGPGLAHGNVPPAPAGLIPELASLYRSARCHTARSPFRPWCIVTNGWQKGQPGDLLPKGKQKVYLGFVVPIKTGAAVSFNRLKLAALVVRKAGKKHFGKIITVTPDNDQERKVMGQAVFNLALVFKGRTKVAQVDGKLLAFLRGQAAKASHALTRTPSGWTLAGKLQGRIRQIAPFWVALEKANTGVFVNLFTDRFAAAPPPK